jgi:hypothetical protein
MPDTAQVLIVSRYAVLLELKWSIITSYEHCTRVVKTGKVTTKITHDFSKQLKICTNKDDNVGFEVFRAVDMESHILWEIMPCKVKLSL